MLTNSRPIKTKIEQLDILQVTVPPYLSYNSHPVKWLPPLSEFGESAGEALESETADSVSVADTKKSR